MPTISSAQIMNEEEENNFLLDLGDRNSDESVNSCSTAPADNSDDSVFDLPISSAQLPLTTTAPNRRPWSDSDESSMDANEETNGQPLLEHGLVATTQQPSLGQEPEFAVTSISKKPEVKIITVYPQKGNASSDEFFRKCSRTADLLGIVICEPKPAIHRPPRVPLLPRPPMPARKRFNNDWTYAEKRHCPNIESRRSPALSTSSSESPGPKVSVKPAPIVHFEMDSDEN